MAAAAYVIVQRTTGLIEESGAFEREAGLLRHMILHANTDGGFQKYVGASSSEW